MISHLALGEMEQLNRAAPINTIKPDTVSVCDQRIMHGEFEERLIRGITEGIHNRSILPLIKEITSIIKLLEQSPKKKGFAFFSCDSFCQPHHEMQQHLLRSLGSTFSSPIAYIQAPAAHFFLSAPDHLVTDIFDDLSIIRETNSRLCRRQKFRSEFESFQVDFFWFVDPGTSIGHSLKQLLKAAPKQEWDSVFINNFPFHELAYRDLSSTYKLDFGADYDIELYRPIIRAAIALMFLTLIGFVANNCYYESNIGASFYSGNNVFRFFCKAIGTTYVYMDGAQLDTTMFGSNRQRTIRLLNTPIDIAYINTPQIATAIFRAKLGRFSRRRVERLIALKLRGLGSHTYSKGIHTRDRATAEFIDLCNKTVNRGGKIVSMFSSSSDELTGQLLAYRHESLNLDHLSPPIFDSQQDWMIQTIKYFGNARPNDVLVIRIHPRLAADHRGLPSSPCLTALMNKLEECSTNFRNIYIVHPSAHLSSYLIGSKSNLIINGWSTIGLDFAILGYRVIYGFPKCTYGGGAFHAVFDGINAYSSLNHYFTVIDQALITHQNENSMASFIIQPDLACKAYLTIHLAGCIRADKKEELQSQLANPQILTNYLVGLITVDYPFDLMFKALFYSMLRRCVDMLRYSRNLPKILVARI